MFNYSGTIHEFQEELLMELSSNLMNFVIAVAGYILVALGMYTIAKRREIRNPWLAWIPLGQIWILGCISDQFRYVTMGQEKSKRKLLLWLEIGVAALATVVCVMIFSVLWNTALNFPSDQVVTDQLIVERVSAVSDRLMGILLLSLLLLGLGIAYTVIMYMALYDLYRSCDPARAVLYTLLTVFLGALAMGITVLVCRDKDFGMPPRRDQPMLNQPVYGLPPQNWQPPQPPKEPWDL